MTIKLIVSRFFWVIFLAGCTEQIPPAPISPLNQHFQNEYFSIDVPDDWKAYKSSSPKGNRYFDFLDPHYPKYRIRVAVGQDELSLKEDDSQTSAWARAELLFSQLFSKDYDIKSRASQHVTINGKPAIINSVETDEFVGSEVILTGANGSYLVCFWLWKDFSPETQERIRQIVFSLNVGA